MVPAQVSGPGWGNPSKAGTIQLFTHNQLSHHPEGGLPVRSCYCKVGQGKCESVCVVVRTVECLIACAVTVLFHI